MGAPRNELRVLTWNLLHGRSVPPAGAELFERFAGALASWEWDVALLQEVPPWWPAALAARLGAEQRFALTSRNALLPLRRAIAIRWPDLIKSNGGGANAILVRGDGIAEHRAQRLSWLPERRWLHAVKLRSGLWVGNLHTTSDARQGRRAAATLRGWAAGGPIVLGGDFNVRDLSLEGFARAGGHGVDQVFVAGGLEAGGAEVGGAVAGGSTRVLDRGQLSDHAPVLVSVMRIARYAC
jgi:endonuclease/exonuclease/phosphatase family metal-dependent hydrolase